MFNYKSIWSINIKKSEIIEEDLEWKKGKINIIKKKEKVIKKESNKNWERYW
jgi:hypothetical protein